MRRERKNAGKKQAIPNPIAFRVAHSNQCSSGLALSTFSNIGVR
jgi:hypothetical protein